MIRSPKWLGLLMAVLFCIVPAHGHAADGYDFRKGLIPALYDGQWATPSCQTPTNVLTIYGHLILEASETTNFAYRITDTAMSDGIFLAHFGNLNFFFRDTRDQRMIVAKVFEDQIADDIPISVQIKPAERYYYKCETLENDWPSLTPVAIKATPKLYALEKACKGAYISKSLPCQRQTFSFLDTDNDGLLSITELERAYTLMVFYAGSISCNFNDNFTDGVKHDKTVFAEDAVQAMDEDKDYKLSPTEILNGWEVARLEPSIKRFLDYIGDLSILLYTIPHGPDTIPHGLAIAQ